MNKIELTSIAVVVLLVISFSTITLVSSHQEPKKPETFNLLTAADGYDPYTAPNITTMTFTLIGGKATFGIQFVGAYSSFGSIGLFGHQSYLQWINIMKINQSTFLNRGNFSLIPDLVKETVSEGNVTIGGLYGSGSIFDPYKPFLTITDKTNQSVQTSFFGLTEMKLNTVYSLPLPYGSYNTTGNSTMSENIIIVSGFNYTYSIEVTPLLEFGPYYEEGSPVWITQTFHFPYNGETLAFGNSSTS